MAPKSSYSLLYAEELEFVKLKIMALLVHFKNKNKTDLLCTEELEPKPIERDEA